MPMYPFRAPSGAIKMVYERMADAPRIGEERTIDGVVCHRTVVNPRANTPQPTHFTSKSLPRNWPYAKRHNAQGQPQFGSKAEVSEAVARSQDTKMDAVDHDAL